LKVVLSEFLEALQVRKQKHNFAVDKAHRYEYNLLNYQISS